jgi:hypothetical protein
MILAGRGTYGGRYKHIYDLLRYTTNYATTTKNQIRATRPATYAQDLG